MQDTLDESGNPESITITEENCKFGGKIGFLIDCITGWLLEIYWATAIMRWSKQADEQGYERIWIDIANILTKHKSNLICRQIKNFAQLP